MWIVRKTQTQGFPEPATRFGGHRRFWRMSDLVEWEAKAEPAQPFTRKVGRNGRVDP
jgi:hypothetical protein